MWLTRAVSLFRVVEFSLSSGDTGYESGSGRSCWGASCSETSHSNSEALGSCFSENLRSREMATLSADSRAFVLFSVNDLKVDFIDIMNSLLSDDVCRHHVVNCGRCFEASWVTNVETASIIPSHLMGYIVNQRIYSICHCMPSSWIWP